jgi:beta-lactam-binding protein with PASTA domain
VAQLNIRRRGLTIGSLAHVSLTDSQQDQVIAQSPLANASGVSAPKINLLINDGPEPAVYVMPNLTGQPLGTATLTLQDAGIKVGKVSVVPLTIPTAGEPQTAPVAPPAVPQANPASMIVSHTPAPGQKIAAGSAVSFEVR